MPASQASYLKLRYFPGLDGLRALSILAVVWHHSTLTPPKGMLGHGPLGVDLFFIISGYLIGTQLLRQASTSGQVDVRAFYARRARRIFPLYFLVLALYTLRALFLMPQGLVRAHFLRSLPAYATFSSNWLVDWNVAHPISFAFAWSLAVEEQFYLLFPWLLWGMLRAPGIGAKKAGHALALVTFALVALDQLTVHSASVWLAGISHALATPILLGVLLAACLHVPTTFVWGRRAASLVWFAPTMALMLLALLWTGAALFWVHLVMTLLVGSVALDPKHGLRWLLHGRPIQSLGRLSYGVYMLHVACVVLVRWALSHWALSQASHPSEGLVFVLVVPLSAVMAKLTHRYVEQPFLQPSPRK
jgi:peptidoglycan/LPS O-acetylase OafA/YrhL